MLDIRDQLRAEVRSEVEAGRLHSFWQYKELLEPYDDHPGYFEGLEGAPVELEDDDGGPGDGDAGGDDAAGGEEDDDDDLGGGGGGGRGRAAELRELEELPDACAVPSVEQTTARAVAPAMGVEGDYDDSQALSGDDHHCLHH